MQGVGFVVHTVVQVQVFCVHCHAAYDGIMSERSENVSIVQSDRGKGSHWPKITSKKSAIGVEPTMYLHNKYCNCATVVYRTVLQYS
jgi:hypothetical protein